MPKDNKTKYIIPLGSLIFIPIGLTVVLAFNSTSADTSTLASQQPPTEETSEQHGGPQYQFQQNAKSAQQMSDNESQESNESQQSSESQEQSEESAPESVESVETEEPDLNTALADYDATNKESVETAKEAGQTKFDDDLLTSKDEIVETLDQHELNPEEMGHVFLPEQPAHKTEISNQAVQLDIPLMLQKDPEWRTANYGSNTTKELGENGCAIVSLAMIGNYYNDEAVTPQDVLEWSGEQYYVDNAGTSWSIFAEFATEFNYQFMNYGNDFYSAMTAIEQGKPIIASVEPGFFTEVGHILVIRGYDEEKGLVYVNDPNDDPEKMFSIQGIDEAVFLKEGLNYWSLSK